MTFELPSGLPKGPWGVSDMERGYYVWTANKPSLTIAWAIPHLEIARAIASIPDMVEEIRRLQSGLLSIEADCSELAEECEEADFTEAERRTYKAIAAKARAILAKSQETAP